MKDPSHLTFARARPSDAAGIARVQHDTWLALYPNEHHGISRHYVESLVADFESPEQLERWRTHIADLTQCTVVAKDAGAVIGFGSAKQGGTANQLTSIYVLPAYHGKEVSRKIMDSLMSWIGDGQDITVEVVSYNERAISFYQKYGFIISDDTGRSGRIPTVFMRRYK